MSKITDILTQNQLDFILNLSNEIKTQDNLSTATPYLYLLTQKREEVRPDTHADDYVLYLDFETKFYSKDELIEYLKHDYSNLSYWLRDNLDELRDFLDADIEGSHASSDYEKLKSHYPDMNVFYFEETQEVSKNDLNVFFTKKAYTAHIEANSYHYNNPKPYVKHAFRNPELEQILEIIHLLAAKIQDERSKKCLWYKKDYSTGCGNSYGQFSKDTIESFSMCPFCGGEMELYDA